MYETRWELVQVNHEKEKVLHHYQTTMDWAEELTSLSERQWRTPIEKDKWTIAEVLGHLIPWDEFVLNQRLPSLLQDVPLLEKPNAEEINQKAAAESRSREQGETIALFTEGRMRLLEILGEIPDELWTQEFQIGKVPQSLYHYFRGLAEHDLHHMGQIQKAL